MQLESYCKVLPLFLYHKDKDVSLRSLTVNNRTGSEVSDKQIDVQGSAGQDQLQRRRLLDQLLHLSE